MNSETDRRSHTDISMSSAAAVPCLRATKRAIIVRKSPGNNVQPRYGPTVD